LFYENIPNNSVEKSGRIEEDNEGCGLEHDPAQNNYYYAKNNEIAVC